MPRTQRTLTRKVKDLEVRRWKAKADYILSQSNRFGLLYVDEGNLIGCMPFVKVPLKSLDDTH